MIKHISRKIIKTKKKPKGSFLMLYTFTFMLILYPSSNLFSKSLKAHSHDKITINSVLSSDLKTLAINIDSPAIHLLGFEHQVKSNKEKIAFKNVKEALTLNNFHLGDHLLCKIVTKDLEFEVESEKDHQDKDHHTHTKKKAKEAVHEAVHSDIEISMELKCEKPIEGETLTINYFKVLEKLNKINFKNVEIQFNLIGPNEKVIQKEFHSSKIKVLI